MTKTPILKKYQVCFTQVPNKVLNDNNLSLKAKGLYAYLFSKPDGWQFFVNALAKDLQENQRQIRVIIKELIEKGYIIRKQINENGKFGGLVYEFIDIFEDINTEEYRMRKNAYTVNSACGKTDIHNNTNNTNNTDNINNINNIYIPKPKTKRNEFIPPTLDEWIEYAKSRKLDINKLKRAYESYTVADWHDSRGNKILNWKQKLINVWDKEENKQNEDILDKPNCPTLEEYLRFQD